VTSPARFAGCERAEKMSSSQSTPRNAVSVSFRDPAGRLFAIDGRIIRIVNSHAVPDILEFLESTTAQKFTASGRLVRSNILEPTNARELLDTGDINLLNPADNSIVVEHEKVPFQNFPYEWSAEMLHSAAGLTLDLAESLLDDGLGLKDATPYNILWRQDNSRCREGSVHTQVSAKTSATHSQ
jgi:hypothetical protein